MANHHATREQLREHTTHWYAEDRATNAMSAAWEEETREFDKVDSLDYTTGSKETLY